jgi:hypothetical protein
VGARQEECSRDEKFVNFLSENLKRRYHFGRLRCRCEDNIKNDIKEIDCEDVD